MDKKIEEARQEFNSILDYIVGVALGREIHEVESGIYRKLLRLGRILLELFVLATGTGKTGERLMDKVVEFHIVLSDFGDFLQNR